MSYYVDTKKSLVIFALKHGSSGMQEIISDLYDIDIWAARRKFEQVDIEGLGREGYLKQHRKWFNAKIRNNKGLPIFVFIRDPKSAAFSAWIEDLNYWLERNSHKALIEMPEIMEIFKTYKFDHFHEDTTNSPFHLKRDHLQLGDKQLMDLILALDKKIYPFFYGHLVSHHLVNVVRLLKMMTYGQYRINTKNIFILDLDDYDQKANELLVEYNIFDKNVIKDPLLDLKHHSTKELVKRLKPLYGKLLKDNFDMNYRLTAEGMSYDHIKEHYKQYFYTPNKFKNFIQESNKKT